MIFKCVFLVLINELYYICTTDEGDCNFFFFTDSHLKLLYSCSVYRVLTVYIIEYLCVAKCPSVCEY